MRKSILIIATVVLGLINANATNLKTTINSVTPVEITKDELVEVYDWTVVTTKGEFSGTAPTLFEAKKRSNLVGQNEVVIEQKITNYFVLKSQMLKKDNRIFFWEVKSEKGYAKGFSNSEFSAKQMINLVAKGDIISYKIIINENK
ncbi:hypothetical protein [Olleya sp. R77988]|uniref:hypothetical protein n=1 Tax=Olleya sp. R77988 TaxID=3093875 RepID=UPI0037CA5FCE